MTVPSERGWTAAVVPGPPLLQPELTGTARSSAAELHRLRQACAAAVAGLLTAPDGEPPRVVVCVGVGRRTRRHEPKAWGTLAGFGAMLASCEPEATSPPTLPLSLTVGRLLLGRAGWRGPIVVQEVAKDSSAADCRATAFDLPTAGAAWLVVGDGSAARTPRAPLSLDPRAEGFDAQAARGLGEGRPSQLLALDAGLAGELGASGRVAWSVLAEAASATATTIDAQLFYDAAPFGVGYLVTRWALS